MKKLTFAALAVMLTLIFASCTDITPPTTSDDGIPNIEYAPGSITFRLDGGGSAAKSSRALSQPLAEYGIEFFEVVFVGDGTTARTSWVIGDSVSIKDVPGTDDTYGYDYSSIDAAGTPAAPSGSAGTGIAVLFAGRQDGTLLAVGTVTKVNGTAGEVINSTSKTVTFGLSALQGDVLTSFSTTAASTDSAFIKAKYFTYPEFDAVAFLPDLTGVKATYAFSASAGTLSFADIFKSFELGTTVTKATAPRYELPSGNFKELKGAAALITTVEDTALDNTGKIIFDIGTGSAQGLTAFSFTIPVFALSDDPGVNSIPAVEWFIRPGYKHHYLDNGGSGSGILFYIADPLPTGLNFNELGIIVAGP